jgi:hypothetical protein
MGGYAPTILLDISRCNDFLNFGHVDTILLDDHWQLI